MSTGPDFHGWTHRPKAMGGIDPTPIYPVLFIKVFPDLGPGSTVTTGDGKFVFAVSDDMDGMNLIGCAIYVTTVSSSGLVNVQIRNITQADANMLSTALTIDAGEFTSYTAATAASINSATDDVAVADLLSIDVDGAGTGAKGLGVILKFALPL